MTHPLARSLAVAVVAAATPAAAQLMPAPTPTADALAAQMRILAGNPRDVSALLEASELSIRLADTSAALAFIARAQAIDPGNPRLQAARASTLVALERPAEALRLYDVAERAGVVMTPYLTQRGLAYDLTGQPTLAQRDYRRVLERSADDETARRLALSLGIAGNRDEALRLLDPLLRRNDRAAWRAWAFVLAMAGDQPGAQKIASGMMVGGAALAPFFARLPALSAPDRAYAVHFGQLAQTPTRIADARFAAGGAPVQVAMQDRTLPTPTNRLPIVARPSPAPTPAPTPVASATLPPAAVAAATTPAAGPVVLPIVRGDPLPNPTTTRSFPPAVTAAVPSSITRASNILVPVPMSTPSPAPAPVSPPSQQSVPIEIVSLPTRRAAPPASQPAAAPPPPPPPPVRTPDVARRNTQMLAAIIETIAVPASELDVAAPPARRPTRAAGEAIAERGAGSTDRPRKPTDSKTVAATTRTAVDLKAATDARKAADAKKLAEAKKAEARKPDPAKAEPQRWWVQVAGGANEDDLDKDWKRVSGKSSALRGKGAYTTPLRATNRLLTGPFKSQAEAMAVVNTLKKDGTAAFAWQSPAGQKISRLSGK